MRISSLVLGVSALANLILVGAVVIGVANGAASDPKVPKQAAEPAAAATPVSAQDAANAWLELHADNLTEQMEKLREDGFPPSMIRAILTAQVRAGFAARRTALEAAQSDQQFWRAASPDPKISAALRALAIEEQKAVKDLLGPDPVNGIAASLRRQFPDFSEDTIEQLTAIRERYDQQRMELYSGIRGGLLPDEQAKVQALEKAMHAEIATVLKPHELEDYDLRTSNTANQLRYELVAFNATEQEFRALFKLKSAFDEQWSFRPGMTEEQMRARSEGHKQLNEQIKVALGADRFAEYQRATDHNYRQTTQLIARLNLPPETANTLYTIQKDFDQRRSNIYQSGGAPPGSPGWDKLVQQTAALQQEAVARITHVLGSAQHVEAYKQYGGSWITSMVPRPASSAARPGSTPAPAPTKSG